MNAALLLLLGLSAPLRAPDLEVEAITTAGAELPELADAVARALVAGGARVMLGGPTSARCLYCAKVAVIESAQGLCRIDVRQEHHSAAAVLSFPPGSPLFDRARAIAIQARLLVTWETGPDAKPKNALTRSGNHKAERKNPVERAAAEPSSTQAEPARPATGEPRPAPRVPSEPAREPPKPAPEHPAAARENVKRSGAKSIAPAVAKPTQDAPIRTEPMLAVVRPPDGAAWTQKEWPWLPTLLGTSAAMAAGICAVVARNRYNALSDKSQPYASAQALKTEGQDWQIASLVLAGVAAVGLGAGITGFVTRPPEHASVAGLVAPIPGGGMFAIAGDLP